MANTKTFTPTFEQCLKRLPLILVESFDPLIHTKKKHLAGLAEFELDLHDEGQIKLTIKERITLKAFIMLCEGKA